MNVDDVDGWMMKTRNRNGVGEWARYVKVETRVEVLGREGIGR
jgi:hypothetical protein